MKLIKTEEAVGHVLCHDMTQIIKGVTKDARFRKGHIVTEEDIPVLLSMGKENLYVWEKNENMLHEDEAAEILREICQGEHMHASQPKEGKIELTSDIDGILTINVEKLLAVNSLEQMMIATRHSYTPVKKGAKLAATRIIPLIIEKEKMEAAKRCAGKEPLVNVLPYKLKSAALITTGGEVAKGLIRDTFSDVVIEKLKAYGIETVEHCYPGDDEALITEKIAEYKAKGVDMILCTGGMSVDPDDRTPGAIKRSGAQIVTYGAPVLPGAMFLLGYFEDGTPVMGLPGCVMYAKSTIFDIMLPRIVNDAVMSAIVNHTAKKGDVLTVARVAGIMGTKQTSNLIPMCHPLCLNKCTVDFEVKETENIIKALCTVKVSGKTGVEMEALMGVNVALLTIYDMCKAMDRAMEIFDVHLEKKDGGKSGLFERSKEREQC